MLESVISSTITVPVFLLCTAVSLALGAGVALVSRFRAKCTSSFSVALTILPATVQLVIMLVNGNIGAGVAVAGAFGLVRFRSAQGSAREIAAIFLAMAIGLATGMGYLTLAALAFVLLGGVMLLASMLRLGENTERVLRVTIPENLDYEGLFDDLFEKYTKTHSLERVKTSNMGTLYELQYRVRFRDAQPPKAFFDELRCRNGNLNISCGREETRETL